ncbi:hypothetical protein ACOJQI_21250 [Bacillus salacetis]
MKSEKLDERLMKLRKQYEKVPNSTNVKAIIKTLEEAAGNSKNDKNGK